MINIGVIGYGYWGPNIVRNFNSLDEANVVSICDNRPEALQRAKSLFPQARLTNNSNDLLCDSEIDVVAVVTPVSTHFDLAKKALENGKHVFVEKPFTSAAVEAEELLELAEKKNLKIMVDHTFLFTGAVRKIKELIDQGTLGQLYYYDSTRVNLGLFQHDVNVVWDLAPHDLSIMEYLVPGQPEALVATGETHFNGLEDVAFITVYYPDALIAHFNVNWLSPVKIRTTLIGGENRMLVWNDLEPDEKIKIYDKGVEIDTREGVYDVLVSYRTGDMLAPKVEQTEALKLETQYFLDCIGNGSKPFNDAEAGLNVVRMLEAADQSIKNRGALVEL